MFSLFLTSTRSKEKARLGVTRVTSHAIRLFLDLLAPVISLSILCSVLKSVTVGSHEHSSLSWIREKLIQRAIKQRIKNYEIQHRLQSELAANSNRLMIAYQQKKKKDGLGFFSSLFGGSTKKGKVSKEEARQLHISQQQVGP